MFWWVFWSGKLERFEKDKTWTCSAQILVRNTQRFWKQCTQHSTSAVDSWGQEKASQTLTWEHRKTYIDKVHCVFYLLRCCGAINSWLIFNLVYDRVHAAAQRSTVNSIQQPFIIRDYKPNVFCQMLSKPSCCSNLIISWIDDLKAAESTNTAKLSAPDGVSALGTTGGVFRRAVQFLRTHAVRMAYMGKPTKTCVQSQNNCDQWAIPIGRKPIFAPIRGNQSQVVSELVELSTWRPAEFAPALGCPWNSATELDHKDEFLSTILKVGIRCLGKGTKCLKMTYCHQKNNLSVSSLETKSWPEQTADYHQQIQVCWFLQGFYHFFPDIF